jgi:Ca-activated chloride channel family protein
MKSLKYLSLVLIIAIVAPLIFAKTQRNLPEKQKKPAATNSIKGKITDADSGESLPFAHVLIKELNTGTAADIDGNYELTNLNAGTYTLATNFVGFKTAEKKVTLKEGETKTINMALSTDAAKLQSVVLVSASKRVDRKVKNVVSKEMISAPEVMELADNISFDMPGTYEVEEIEMEPVGQIPITGTSELSENGTEEYNLIQENDYKDVIKNPLSTFSIDVDNASYSNMRRYISYNQKPPKDAIRIEEMINYFTYDYPQPKNEHPFSIITELSECPWNTEANLLHVGLQGKELSFDNIQASNLVFLIDVSGSMQPANKLGLLKTSLKKLVDQLSPDDRVAIVVYAGAAGAVLPSTLASKKTEIKSAIDRLESGGSTAGGAGIKLAYKIAVDNLMDDGNNRIILCTDGDFNVGASSDAEMVRLIEEKRTTGVFLTVCGFGMGNYKDSKMEKIADLGNGNYYYIDGENEANKVFVTDLRATLFTIAKDVKIQIEFNPAKVESYRLVGYENRLLNKEDFEDDTKDAGELGAGHTVTALYEIVLTNDETSVHKGESELEIPNQKEHAIDDLKYQVTTIKSDALFTEELMTVKLRYKDPKGSKSKLIEHPMTESAVTLKNASDNFKFSAAVAEFGLLLRDSKFKGNASCSEVIKLAQASKGNDKMGYRNEFIGLVQASQSVIASK